MSKLHSSLKELNDILSYPADPAAALQAFYRRLAEILQAEIVLFWADGSIFYRANARGPILDSLSAKRKGKLEDWAPSYWKDFLEEHAAVYNRRESRPGNEEASWRHYCILPLFVGTIKESGILIIRDGPHFTRDDIALCDCARTIATLMLTHRAQNRVREEAWQRAASKMACGVLSSSERRALAAVLAELENDCGNVVLCSVAKRMYVAKSLITGALKKLESAGVIATRSMGVKGMHIEVLNPYLMQDLQCGLRDSSLQDAEAVTTAS